MRKLLVVDGNSMFCAGYYGLRKYGLTSEDGLPTGGIYAFLSMISNFIKKNSYEKIVFAFDTATSKDANKELLDEYKSNRSTKPDDFFFRINTAKALLPLLGFTTYESKKWEADDVIATLVKQNSGKFDAIDVRTSDTDMYRLISDNVEIVRSEKRFGRSELKEKMGSERFGPEHYVLYKSLVGDTADNVAGVDKVGPKTAVKILEECSFNHENVLNHPKISPHTEKVTRNINVITLNCSVDECDMDIISVKSDFDTDGLADIELTKLGIKSLGIKDFKIFKSAVDSGSRIRLKAF